MVHPETLPLSSSTRSALANIWVMKESRSSQQHQWQGWWQGQCHRINSQTGKDGRMVRGRVRWKRLSSPWKTSFHAYSAWCLVQPSFWLLPNIPMFYHIKKHLGKGQSLYACSSCFLCMVTQTTAELSLRKLAQCWCQCSPAFVRVLKWLFQHAFTAWTPCSLQSLIIVLFSGFGKCYSSLLPAASNLFLTSLQSPWQCL